MEGAWSNTLSCGCMRVRGKRECGGGGTARSDRANAGGGGLPEFSHVPIDAGPSALLHSFAVGRRSGIPRARSMPHTVRFLKRMDALLESAARCYAVRDDWLSPTPVVAGLQTRAFNLFVLAVGCPSRRFCV